MINTHSNAYLASMLITRHERNVNGCLITDYASIPHLQIKASDTNGTSGIGIWYGKRVYWHYTDGMRWTGKELVRMSDCHFVVEAA